MAPNLESHVGLSLVIDLTIDSGQVGWVLITLCSQFIAIATQSSVASFITNGLNRKVTDSKL